MATLVRSDRQADTQQLIRDYVADNSCDVVGLGDTRLGDDPSELTRMARGIQGRVAREREERRWVTQLTATRVWSRER